MNSHPLGLNTGFGRDGGLCEELLAAPPYRHQTLKRRAVLVSARRQPRVSVRNVHAFRTDRRPHRHIHRSLGGGYPERAFSVPQPLRLGVIKPGIHRHRTAAGVTGGPDDHLNPHAGARPHHQRAGQYQLVDDPAADLVGGPDDQLHETGTGKKHHPADLMIGQPRLSCQRQPAGQHDPPGIGSLEHRTQQRVPGPPHAQSGCISGPGRVPRRPEPPPLERVGGQFHPSSARAGENCRPVNRQPRGKQPTGRTHERGQLRAAFGQHRDHHGLSG